MNETQKRKRFEESKQTLTQYMQNATAFKTTREHAEALAQCVAIKQNGEYIVKERKENTYTYKVIKRQELAERLWANYKIEKDDEYGDVKTSSFDPMKLFKSGEARAQYFAFYDDIQLLSNDENTLNRYVPPQGDAPNPDLIERFITFFKGRLYNPEALDEELSAHAFRLRNPAVTISKIFIHYSKEENTGKTFLMSAFHELYPSLSMVGIKSKEVKSNFDGWMTDYLNLGFEELENEEYRNQFFETFIKQITSEHTSKRKMYHDTEAGAYKCIVSLNTNSEDLYGLIRADKPTRSRLVILEFKPKPTETEWEDFKNSVGLNKKSKDYEKTRREFAAAFYHYLRHTYEIPHDFNPNRYYNEKKDALIERLRTNSNRLPMRFIKALCLKSERGVRDAVPILSVKISSASRIKYISVLKQDLENRFDRFTEALPKTNNERKLYTSQAVIKELTEGLKWVSYHTNKGAAYKIEQEKFDKWKELQMNNSSTDETEEMENVSDTDTDEGDVYD